MSPVPSADVDVSLDLVRGLLRDQHPDLADLPLRLAASGWDNVLFRLGDTLAVRLPRRAVSAALVEHEQTWLPRLAARLPVTVPVPVRTGTPGCGFPWSWSITEWVPGRAVATIAPPDRGPLAEPLADMIVALHVAAPPDAPDNTYRGVPLALRDTVVTERLAALPRSSEVLGLWRECVAAPAWSGPAVWVHGDLHPLNILADDTDRLAAVIDFGDLTSGDPATDLATGWLTFDTAGRHAFCSQVDARRAVAGLPPHDAATWLRARGWALVLAGHGDEAATMRGAGRHGLAQALAGR